MAESFNIYLDESCHLENDGINIMTLGAIWCPQEKCREVSLRVRDIQSQYGLAHDFEFKWTKISPAKLDFYRALLDYFLDDDDLHFRGVVIPDKTKLDHNRYEQTHDDWYYKMCFTLLEPIVDPTQHYSIYLDIKDTRSESKRKNLEGVLRNANYDGSGNIVRRIQQIRSHESELMQLADLLIGAVTYANRGLTTSPAKLAMVDRLRRRTNLSLTRSTWLREPKLNLLVWNPEQRI
jgi:Protein of unknown function (DUF3800)